MSKRQTGESTARLSVDRETAVSENWEEMATMKRPGVVETDAQWTDRVTDPAGDLTLRDIEALASRLGAALATIREASGILRGGGEREMDPPRSHLPPLTLPRPAPPPSTLTPEQQAALDSWRKDPRREKLLAEIRARDGGEPE